MLLGKKFAEQYKGIEGDLVFPRAGVAQNFIIPKELKQSINLELDVENDNVIARQSSSALPTVVTEKIGLILNEAPVEGTLFFINGGFVLQIEQGNVVMEHPNGGIYAVDEAGDVFTEGLEPTDIRWYSYEEVLSQSTMIVKPVYALETREQALSYVNNLVVAVRFDFSTPITTTRIGGRAVAPMSSFRLFDHYTALGLEKFEFIDYNKPSEEDLEEEETLTELAARDIDEDDEEIPLEVKYDMAGMLDDDDEEDED